VAAAVVGGTSLFGGRGRVRDAVLGGIVIAIIPNGLLLHPDINAAFQYVITGAFLLVAAAIDALGRRHQNR
jgi:D-xylose transport system permease protein